MWSGTFSRFHRGPLPHIVGRFVWGKEWDVWGGEPVALLVSKGQEAAEGKSERAGGRESGEQLRVLAFLGYRLSRHYNDDRTKDKGKNIPLDYCSPHLSQSLVQEIEDEMVSVDESLEYILRCRSLLTALAVSR